MLQPIHSDKKLLEDHDTQDPMMTDFSVITYVDFVGAVQALFDLSANELGDLPTRQLMRMTLHVFDKHQEYLTWSKYVREHYAMCHPDCHALRIQHYVKHGLTDLHSVT